MDNLQKGMKELSASFYEKNNEISMKELKKLAPEQHQAFLQFEREIFKPGVLTKKEKEIIAVSIAHITECPYCIDVHTKKAKAAGATLPELVEAIFVVASVEACGIVQEDEAKKENNPIFPMNRDAFKNFQQVACKEGALSAKLKEIIAISASYAIKCSSCIKLHTENALKLGVHTEEIEEAICIAAALKAGGAYGHLINLMDSFHESI